MIRAASHLVALPTPPTGKTTVVVAEDHAAMRRSLRRLLERTPGVEVVAEAGDLALTRRHLEGHRPDVLVLDLNMPEGSSVQLVEELAAHDGARVILTSVEDTPGFAQRAFAAGASGFVLKERADEELPQALQAACRGERYLSPLIAQRLAS